MKYTKNLNLPIYDNPYQDKFDLSEWNEANEAIDSTYGELKVLKDEIASVNPNVEIIDARCGEKTLGDKVRNIDTSINNIIDKNEGMRATVEKHEKDIQERIKKNDYFIFTSDYINNFDSDVDYFNYLFSLLPNGGVINIDSKTYNINKIFEVKKGISLIGNNTIFNILGSGNILLRGEQKINGISFNNILESDNTTGARRGLWLDNATITDGSAIQNVIIENNKFINFFYSIDSRDSSGNNKKNKNIVIKENYILAPKNVNSGAIILQNTEDIFISNNLVIGGKTSSAIGVTSASGECIISNNIVRENIEASIQLENFHTSQESDVPINCIIEGNVVDGAIWLDDVENVICDNNLCDTIQVTTQDLYTDNILLTNNIVGNIYVGTIYTPQENATVKTIKISDNMIIGAKYQWDGQPLRNTNGIFTTSKVLDCSILNNFIKDNVFESGIKISVNNALSKYIVKGNNVAPVLFGNEVAKVKLCDDVVLDRYTTVNRPTNNLRIGMIIYDSTLQCPIYYKKSNTWAKFDGTEV